MSGKITKKFNDLKKYFINQRRDTRYVIVFIFSVLIFLISSLQAVDKGLFDSVELPIFDAINNLPSFLDSTMSGLTQLGGLGSLVLWMGVAWFLINRRAAFTVAGASIFSWFFAKFFKTLIARGRPEAVLDSFKLFNDKLFGGYGFPSGHSTFVAACITVLYFQVERKYRKYLLLAVFAVGISRMYLGAHFPLDVVGGWALGAAVGSFICLLFGVSSQSLSVNQIKTALRKKGHPMRHLEFANVDARGSRPVFMVDMNGKEYFGKIFGAQEHAADWLFKTYRFFRFKNLQSEEPYISSRRNVEMESFATIWARQAGVRVTKIVDLVRVRSSWILMLERLDARSLDGFKRIKQTSLVDVWRQVEKLHNANIAHRDLRAANIMIDKQGKAWIIDYGFAEVSPRKLRQYMDIAELLMSMTLIVGTKRTVDSALKIIDKSKLQKSLPYLKQEVFSGATTKNLRKNKQVLEELKNELIDRLHIKEEIEDINITRINRRKVVNLVLIGIFLYIVLPQFKLFKDAFEAMDSIRLIWLLPIAITSTLTYVFTGYSYVILSSVPLKLGLTSVVQLAASFISKIIPGGIGNSGLNARYLYKAGNDHTDAAAIIATNGIIGIAMFILPTGLFLLFKGESLSTLISVKITATHILALFFTLVVSTVIMYMFKKLRRKFMALLTKFITGIREFTNSPTEILLASISAIAVSICYILCLFACFKALGIDLGLTGSIIVYASAVIAKSVVPTPGGLGPLEIAMVSALLTLGIDKTDAFSVVLLYRLATFWLPIPFSVWAYRYISNRKLI